MRSRSERSLPFFSRAVMDSGDLSDETLRQLQALPASRLAAVGQMLSLYAKLRGAKSVRLPESVEAFFPELL